MSLHAEKKVFVRVSHGIDGDEGPGSCAQHERSAGTCQRSQVLLGVLAGRGESFADPDQLPKHFRRHRERTLSNKGIERYRHHQLVFSAGAALRTTLLDLHSGPISHCRCTSPVNPGQRSSNPYKQAPLPVPPQASLLCKEHSIPAATRHKPQHLSKPSTSILLIRIVTERKT